MGIQPSPVLIDAVVKLPRLSRETCRLSCGRVDGVEAAASRRPRHVQAHIFDAESAPGMTSNRSISGAPRPCFEFKPKWGRIAQPETSCLR